MSMRQALGTGILLVLVALPVAGYAEERSPAEEIPAIGEASADVRDLGYFRAYPLADQGYALIREDRIDEAIPYFRRATALAPHHLPYRLQWVDLLVRKRELQEARTALEPALLSDPADPRVLAREAILVPPEPVPESVPIAQEDPVHAAVAVAPKPAPVSYCAALRALSIRNARQEMDTGYCLVKQGRPTQAITAFEAAAKRGDTAIKRQAYRQLAALHTAAGDAGSARQAGAALLQYEPEAADYYDQSLRLQQQGLNDEARALLEQAHHAAPDHQLYRISLAYAYRAAGMNAEAIPLFDAATRAEPGQTELHENYAYALKAGSHRAEAAQQFRQALPGIDDPQKHYGIRREIQQMEDKWVTVGSATYRDGVARASGTPGLQNYLDSVQYGMESVYSPDDWQHDGRRVQLYGQLFVSSDSGKANINGRSAQGALGIRATPLKDTEWYLYAARLVGVGSDALDDWQLRTTYAYTEGFDYDPTREHWPYLFLTPDIAYIVDRDELYTNVEGRYGHSIRADNWVFTPHLVGAAAHQRIRDTGSDSVEFGLGASIKYWFAETAERAPRGSSELILQWREPVGSSEDKGGPFVRLVLQY